MNIDNDEQKPSKVDWSTPYDEWLIPILNRFRYGGAIECRAIPSAVQLHIDKLLAAQRQALRDEVMDKLPGCQNHPSYSDPDIHQVAQAHYDQGWNDLHWQVRQAISTIFEGKE